MARPRLVAVVGPTGSGKSALAIELAEALGGEVVNADAYSLYRGMDIGTAKVEAALRDRVPHHLIDVADPDEPLTLARYLESARRVLDDTWSRGRLPVLCGGSGQYVWALTEGWQVPRVAPDPALREELETLGREQGAEAVLARLAAVDPQAAARADPRNVRRLVRAVEVVTHTGLPLAACQTRQPLDAEVLVIGLRWPRDVLYRMLDARTEAHYDSGLIDEVQRLRDAGYGDTAAVREAVSYREASACLDGTLSLEEAVERTKNANHRLVRRQGAWFKDEDARIRWIDGGAGAVSGATAVAREWLAAEATVPHA